MLRVAHQKVYCIRCICTGNLSDIIHSQHFLNFIVSAGTLGT